MADQDRLFVGVGASVTKLSADVQQLQQRAEKASSRLSAWVHSTSSHKGAKSELSSLYDEFIICTAQARGISLSLGTANRLLAPMLAEPDVTKLVLIQARRHADDLELVNKQLGRVVAGMLGRVSEIQKALAELQVNEMLEGAVPPSDSVDLAACVDYLPRLHITPESDDEDG
jgi:hypothetical protein